jgi:phage minor structural protein
MICIYSPGNTNYSNNGDAVLIPISCFLNLTINGAWQLDLEHPYDAEERYKLIQEGAVIRADIKCVGEQSTIRQRFRVYTYNKGVNSVTCIAFPIAMEATFDAPIDNLVLENKTASEAAAQLQALTQKYSIETNVTGTKSTSFANTNINSALASGDDGCFIQVWGGEVVYDNLKFNIRSRIGSDTGYKIQYGHNMTGIDYSKDDSGLSTRVHPISEDGIRLNGTGYVDSPLIDEYPIHHDRYMITPYRLVDTEEASPSRTAQATRACVSAVTTATTTLSQSSYATALGAGYQPDYIKTINADIITAVQNMALVNVISTDLYKLLSDTIKNAMAWLADLTQPEWGWMGSDETGWRYGDTNGYAKDMYVRIGKTWSYFGSQGYWEEPKDDMEEWDWYQKEGEGRRYGNFNKYFAHNTFVYITMDGTLQEYWMNEEGWYEADESGESEWSWHGSGTSEDPYWFGEEGATSEDPKKYAHDTWLFIDGAYYFFDSYGYYAPNTAILDYQWDWVQDDERWWFGNAIDREFAAVYVESQWLKINGTWYYFDEDGYVVDQDSSRSDAIAVFTTGMASLLTTVNTRKDALYTLLYALMTEWVNKKYAEGIDKPALTVTVSMADLSRTTEYANFAALETIKLGDSVEIDDTEHGIHTTGSRVIGLTYDVIRGYNSNVVIGKPQATVSSMLSQASGQAVAGGFDTSAIEAQIDALQDRVSDVRYNGRSLLQGTIAILDSIGGTSINYGTSTPTGGSDGDVYFQTDVNGNIVKIWQNHSGVWSGMTGGGLEYFIESENALYGINGDAQYMREDPKFRHTAPAVFACYLQRNSTSDYAVHTCPNVDYNDIVGIRGSQFAPLFGRVGGDGIFIISKDPTHCYFTVEEWNGTYPQTGAPNYSDSYSYSSTHNVKTELNVSNKSSSGAISDSFTFEGETYYIVIDGQSWDWWTIATEIETENKWFSFATWEYPSVEGYYETVGAYGLAIMQANNASQKYNGISRNSGLAFFAGADDEDGTNAPIKIYEDGTAEGLATTADLTLKQDKLIAGDNISIGSDGKTINAKVYANPEDTATEAMSKLQVGDTIYEIQGGGGGGSNLILDAQRYSLEEQVVGIWTDGKPLYQKTLYSATTVIGASTNFFDLSALYIDEMVDWHGNFIRDGKNYSVDMVEKPSSSSANTYARCRYVPDTKQFAVNVADFSGYPTSFGRLYVTIKYTKTTDTAGSGGYQAYGFSPIVCSDAEREVGVWEDNKPLYQKTFIGTLGGTVGSDVSNYKMADLSDIDTIASISGTLQGITPINSYYASDNYNMVFVNGAKNGLYCNGKNIGGNTYKVTIQYTKASDTAGSGEYNTLAIPNVHYDGEEKVVGTWYGETMYEKTYISTTAVNAGGYVILDANLTNASHLKVKGITCKASQTSSSEIYPNVYTSTIGGKNIEIAISNSSGLYAENYTSLCIRNLEVTVQYTKTT